MGTREVRPGSTTAELSRLGEMDETRKDGEDDNDWMKIPELRWILPKESYTEEVERRILTMTIKKMGR